MEDDGVDSQSTGGFLFSRPAPTVYAQVQDKDAFVKWAEENEPDLVRAEPRKGDLNALVRSRMDDNQGLPPGIGWYDDKGISVRKVAGK